MARQIVDLEKLAAALEAADAAMEAARMEITGLVVVRRRTTSGHG
jgi:hypothetical protein